MNRSIAPQEDGDGDDGTDDGPRVLIHAQHDVEPQGRAADVADVEGQASERHGKGQEIAQARQHPVGDILSAQARNGKDAPDIELDNDVHEDRDHNGEGEGGFQPFGEHGRLRNEARADG